MTTETLLRVETNDNKPQNKSSRRHPSQPHTRTSSIVAEQHTRYAITKVYVRTVLPRSTAQRRTTSKASRTEIEPQKCICQQGSSGPLRNPSSQPDDGTFYAFLLASSPAKFYHSQTPAYLQAVKYSQNVPSLSC